MRVIKLIGPTIILVVVFMFLSNTYLLDERIDENNSSNNALLNQVEVGTEIEQNRLKKDDNKKENQNEVNNEIKNENTVTETIVEPTEITIYDLEDGYITIPYNKFAKKHNYDWNNLKNNNGLYKYEDENYTTVLGVDVSTFQQEIDWNQVKASGIDFAILRLGLRGYGKEGKILLDTKFEENYANATNAGIEVGVYFFSQATSVDEVKQEANFVLENLKEKSIKYPVVYDLEVIKNTEARTNNLTKEDKTLFAMTFCDEIGKAGYKTSIYGCAKTFTMLMNLEKINNYDKWYADYQEKPLYPYEFSMWQYTESGHVDGIDTNVDIDLYFVKK